MGVALMRSIARMVAVTGDIPTPRRPRVADAGRLLAHRAAASIRSTAARLSGSILTVAGLGCIDVGAFEAHPIAGWIVTGFTVLLLDWKLDASGGDR